MSNFVLQIFINILAMLGGYFVGIKKERWKITQENRQKHLKEIQEQVFQPILEILKNHWLPVFERKRVNLQIKSETKYEQNTVTPNPVLSEYYFLNYEEPTYVKPINQYLYKDAMDRHYPIILEKYGAFKLKAEEYVKDCLSYAKEIKEQISSKIDIPEYNRLYRRSSEWIKSCHLAKFIVRKQIVPNDGDLSLKFEEISDVPLISSKFGEISGVPLLKSIRDESFEEYGLCKNPEKIREELDQTLKKRDKADELIYIADKLKIDCLSIRDEIEKLCLTKEITGGCNFC
jgi:hypothetical protein